MIILKFIIKILILPVLAVIILGQWIALFLNSISSVIFGILSTLIWSLVLLCFLFGESTGAETMKMLIFAFVIFIIPHIGNWIIERIVIVRCILSDFLGS